MQKKPWYRVPSTVFSLAILIIGFLLVLFSRAVITWLEAHDKLAGWAQTLGTLAAICVAIAYPERQRRVQRQEHIARGTKVAMHVALDVADALAILRDEIKADLTATGGMTQSDVDDWRARLRAVDAVGLPPLVHHEVTRLRAYMAPVLRHLADPLAKRLSWEQAHDAAGTTRGVANTLAQHLRNRKRYVPPVELE